MYILFFISIKFLTFILHLIKSQNNVFIIRRLQGVLMVARRRGCFVFHEHLSLDMAINSDIF